MISGPRALLMQAAHPLAVEGLLAHTTGLDDPYTRLERTAEVMNAIGFGSREEADRMTRRVRAMHRRVRGELERDAGNFPAGTPYAADDPALLMWVLFSLVDSGIVVYERFVKTMRPAEKEAYWHDFRVVGSLFGLADERDAGRPRRARRLPPRHVRERRSRRHRLGPDEGARDRPRAAGPAQAPARWSRRSTSSRSRCCRRRSARSTTSRSCRRRRCASSPSTPTPPTSSGACSPSCRVVCGACRSRGRPDGGARRGTRAGPGRGRVAADPHRADRPHGRRRRDGRRAGTALGRHAGREPRLATTSARSGRPTTASPPSPSRSPASSAR